MEEMKTWKDYLLYVVVSIIIIALVHLFFAL